MSTVAKRFWPPTEHKLLYANLIVYGVTIALLLAFNQQLMWSQKMLRSYIGLGVAKPPADNILVQEAMKHLKAGEDIKRCQQLLEQALEIESYSKARLLLGICYLRQGDKDKMLDCYEQYRMIDPSFVGVYTPMIKILLEKDDREAIEKLLTEGIEHFKKRIELYEPQIDPTVPERFNLKALKVYKTSKEGLGLLEKMQEQLKHPK